MNKSIQPGLLWYCGDDPVAVQIELAKSAASRKYPHAKIGRILGSMDSDLVVYDRGVPHGHLWLELIQ